MTQVPDPEEWDYNMYCPSCRVTVSTYSPQGTQCDCRRVQADWMRAHRQEMFERSERHQSNVTRFKP